MLRSLPRLSAVVLSEGGCATKGAAGESPTSLVASIVLIVSGIL
jgi:hypothetical protein